MSAGATFFGPYGTKKRCTHVVGAGYGYGPISSMR
jgi:hypothetical protein